MLDNNIDSRDELNFGEYAEVCGQGALGSHSRAEHALPANDSQQQGDSLVDTLDLTRVKLASFGLLDRAEERNLAQEMANAAREIALITVTCDRTAQELLSLLDSSRDNTLDKSRFSVSERYYALRRELAHLQNTEGNAAAVTLLVEALQAGKPLVTSVDTLPATLEECISTVDWPGPLMLALAKRQGSKVEAASTLDLAIDEYFSGSQIHSNAEWLPIDGAKAQLDCHVKSYLDARETLVKHNLRLIFHVAKRYTQRPDYLIDLFQEGTFGLMRAAEKFRPAMGYRFSTYAYQWIESKIRTARVNIDRVITISPDYNNDLIRLSQWVDHQKANDKTGSTHDLLKDLGISKDRHDALMRIKNYSLSLDDNPAEGLSLHSKVASSDSNLFESVADESSAEYLNSIMKMVLTDRESYIINERFGRLDSDSKTFQQLSEILGISRERVRQLESIAIEKMRDWMGRQDQLSFNSL
ncbi:sigma-70 family RNA polymerase sigma factor [Pseudomaricurvus sp.]|uniref:sigma-70 family RNA polymerase sigma factor n=1 Tax=Pseudomaricurvus sp. TaxID=2004510 RepID=UPI003F6C295F